MLASESTTSVFVSTYGTLVWPGGQWLPVTAQARLLDGFERLADSRHGRWARVCADGRSWSTPFGAATRKYAQPTLAGHVAGAILWVAREHHGVR